MKKTAKSTSGKTEEPEPDSAFLRMYLKELRSLEKLTKAEERELAERLVALVAKEAALEAEEEHLFHELKNRFVEHKLRHVVSRARKYSLGGEWLDELIQEGNIGLMAAVQMLAEQAGGGKPAGAVNGRILNADSFQDTDSPRAADNFQDADSFLAFVEEQIEEAMDRYINESYASGSEEQAMVAKVNFVSEAAKALKEETGQEPTLAEMAAYTNITEDELSSIINLSADNLKA